MGIGKDVTEDEANVRVEELSDCPTPTTSECYAID